MEELIPEVKERVGALISKPKMSDKLLNKPPFRFLHDTISAIIVKTGFAECLYTDEEMDSSTITDKALKIAYLEKIISLVGICQGEPLDIRPTKVVAGLEPENTSKFLIAFATFASDERYDSRAAVKHCLAGGQPGDSLTSDNRSESKEEREERHHDDAPKSYPLGDTDDNDMKRGPDPMDVPQASERGKSRGGQRSGKSVPQTSALGLDGGSSERPANLDAEIERCDGSNEMTKELVGALITRPKLSDKLLGKPPFRFLHDIITEIIKKTGFATDLYSPEELLSENVKDKDSKIQYLEKIIKLVGIHLNTLTEVKAQKIVAGLEPVNTNRFLQLLAVCASSMPNSTRSVRLVHEALGLVPAGGHTPEPSHHQDEKNVDPPVKEERSRPHRREQPPAESKEDERRSPPPRQFDDINKHHFEEKPMEDDSHALDSKADGDVDKKSMRPTTARRRPPPIKDPTKQASAKEVAPAGKKTEGIMIDGQDDDDEDEIIEEDDRLADAKDEGDLDRNNPQSKLVQDIMSRQAEQEAAAKSKANMGQNFIDEKEEKTENTKTGGIRLGRLRKTGLDKKGSSGKGVSSGSDIERLRKAVQVLVQHTGPLGTCMDYIQEDVSIMSSELHRWEEECRKYEIEVESQKKKTDEILSPLQRELEDVELQIQEQQLKVSVTKASIAKNESRIQQILRLTATA